MVPAYKRDEDALTVLNKTRELVSSAYRIVHREDMLPKKKQRTIGEPLLRDVRELACMIMAANNYNTNIYSELERRIQIQYDALDRISYVLVGLNLVQTWANCNPAKLEEIFKLADSVKHLMKKWIEYSHNCAAEIEQSENFTSEYVSVKSKKKMKSGYRYASSIKGKIPFFTQSCVSC